jgi:hypothetical protein
MREVEIELSAAHARYDQLGYYAVLGTDPYSPEALGERFRDLTLDVPKALRSGGAGADVLARLLTDQRFRARARAVGGVQHELADLRGTLALFEAQTDAGSTCPTPRSRALAQRADLAATRLRRDPARPDRAARVAAGGGRETRPGKPTTSTCCSWRVRRTTSASSTSSSRCSGASTAPRSRWPARCSRRAWR